RAVTYGSAIRRTLCRAGWRWQRDRCIGHREDFRIASQSHGNLLKIGIAIDSRPAFDLHTAFDANTESRRDLDAIDVGASHVHRNIAQLRRDSLKSRNVDTCGR